MRNFVTIGFAAGLLAAALPAQAAASTSNSMRSDTHAQNQVSRSGDDRQICVREQRTESRVNHPIRHTAREWRDIEGEVPGERSRLSLRRWAERRPVPAPGDAAAGRECSPCFSLPVSPDRGRAGQRHSFAREPPDRPGV